MSPNQKTITDLPLDALDIIAKTLKKTTVNDILNPSESSSYTAAIEAGLYSRPTPTTLQQDFMNFKRVSDALLDRCIHEVTQFGKSQAHPKLNIIPRMKNKMQAAEDLIKELHSDLKQAKLFYSAMTNATPEERGKYVIAKMDSSYFRGSISGLTEREFISMAKAKMVETGHTFSRTWFEDSLLRVVSELETEYNKMLTAFGEVRIDKKGINQLETIIKRRIIIAQRQLTYLGLNQEKLIQEEILRIVAPKTSHVKGGKRK
jgi:hypothetical protein